jgi:predicted nucleic-acid-binding protein
MSRTNRVIAVDTNILLRVIVGDDPKQQAIAQDLIDAHEIYVSLTVVMETEWVLRSRYGFKRQQVAEALRSLFTAGAFVVERRDRVEWALERYELSGDFADLIHLSATVEAVAAFASFDAGVAAAAGRNTPVTIMQLGKG